MRVPSRIRSGGIHALERYRQDVPKTVNAISGSGRDKFLRTVLNRPKVDNTSACSPDYASSTRDGKRWPVWCRADRGERHTTIVTPPPPAWIGDRSCGVAWGPDGILDIVALTPGVECRAAKRAADTYMSDVDGFMSSNPLEVGDGWTCQISIRDRGEIVRCSVGQREISLNRRIGQAGAGKGTDAGTFSPSS